MGRTRDDRDAFPGDGVDDDGTVRAVSFEALQEGAAIRFHMAY